MTFNLRQPRGARLPGAHATSWQKRLDIIRNFGSTLMELMRLELAAEGQQRVEWWCEPTLVAMSVREGLLAVCFPPFTLKLLTIRRMQICGRHTPNATTATAKTRTLQAIQPVGTMPLTKWDQHERPRLQPPFN